MLYVGLALICGIILTIFLILEKLCTSMAKNSAILMTVGTNNLQLFQMYIVQIVIANLIAIAVSSPISICVFDMINYMLNNILNIGLSISIPLFFNLIGVGFCCIFVLTLISIFYLMTRLKNKQIYDLL